MNNANKKNSSVGHTSQTREATRRTKRRVRIRVAVIGLAAAAAVGVACACWLNFRATSIKSELEAAAQLIPALERSLTNNAPHEASLTAADIRAHTAVARQAAEDPLWTLAAAIPGLGENFSAVAEVARSADDVATLGVTPLVKVFGSLSWDSILPSSAGTDLSPLQDAAPSVSAAAHAVRVSAERLERIDTKSLLPMVSAPLTEARDQLREVAGVLDTSANAAAIAPGMLGANGTRTYLLMIQNNAEARASGGIPGALAVLSLDNGKLTLGTQSSAGELGVMSPPLPVDAQQEQIYSLRIGKYIQDVNLTPDFPTAARAAQAMWERKTGQRVDGVISIDPVALGYILDATGPVKITDRELIALASAGLPTELTGSNVVQTLLSDVYARIERPFLQDVYFAGVAQEIFAALADGRGNAKGLIDGLARAAAESRVLVWAGVPGEQSVIAQYALSGAIAGPSISPAQFGVYFNDSTGAKMDYYVERTVQLFKECASDGYEQTTVRVTNTNTAPDNAATSLPAYVTGDGIFGVPAGSVQTNIVVYGPIQAHVETAMMDGKNTGFAPYLHANRPVGVLAVRLAPGETKTVEFTFGKIVQHTEPNVVVTPTVQNVNDVIQPTQVAECSTAR